MTDKEFSRITAAFLADIKSMTPVNKNFKAPTRGNLRRRATRGKSVSHGRYTVTVSADVAPYFPYVNSYTHHYHRNKAGGIVQGRENPNYHYLENAIDIALENLARKAGGIIVRG